MKHLRVGGFRLSAVMFLVAALVASPAAEARAQSTSATVTGTIRSEEGQPLRGAHVSVEGLGRAALTDEEGRFTVRGLSPGRHRIAVSLIGYAPVAREIEVQDGAGTIVFDAHLTRTALSLPGVQVTATPTSGDVRAATQATTQLSGRGLERELSSTIAETLRFQPGIAVRSMGPAASAPIIRGLTGDRVLVLQDGQRSADLAGSADDHAVTIDPLTARRIEVVRGPATLLYGNNALGGVVNVISGDIPLEWTGRREIEANLQMETAHPGGSGGVRFLHPVAEGWTLSARGGVRRTGDVRIPSDPVLGDRLANTETESANVSVGLGFSGENLLAGGTFRGYGFRYGLPVPPGNDRVELEGSRFEASVRGEVDLPTTWFRGARVDATVQSYEHDELDGDGVSQQEFALDTGTLNLLVRQARVGLATEGAWGASLLTKEYAATGPAALTPAATSRGIGIFGYQELALTGDHGPALQAGVRYDTYRIESLSSEKFGPGVRRNFNALSGSAGVRVPFGDAVSAGFHVARSFRAPTVEELFSNAPHAGTGSVELGDPGLRSERGVSVEGVLQIRSLRWNGQFAAYRNHVSNYVHLVARGDTIVDGVTLPVFVHGQTNATLAGLEGQIEWALGDEVVVGITGDYLHASQADGTPLSFMPPARLGGIARWDSGRFSIGGDAHWEFRQDRIGSADEEPTDAHLVLRLTAAARWIQGPATHSLTLRVDNLTDTLHREATSRVKDFAPGPGRNISLLYRVQL